MKNSFFTQFLLFISSISFAKSITLTPTNSGANMEGRIYYDNVAKEFGYWNDSVYVPLGGSGGSGVSWALSGTHFHNTNAGNLGIGISTLNERLHLHNATTCNTPFVGLQLMMVLRLVLFPIRVSYPPQLISLTKNLEAFL